MIRLALTLSLLTLALCRLEVYSPAAVRDQFNRDFNYTVANFGHIPFGKTLIGPLYVVEPIDGCEFDKLKPLPSTQTPFLLIRRGGCNFVKKVENAEKMGAKLAIIMDNIPENTGYLTMKDDGTGYRVKIPSILISINDGEALQKTADSNVTLKITFDTAKSDRVNLTLWLEANNRESYHLVREFAADYQKVKGQVDLRLVHHTVSCYFCRSTDCYGEGKFCALNHDLGSRAQGKDIINQQLREQAVFELYPDQWWSYMDKFDLECDDLLSAKQCSEKLFKQLNLDAVKIEALLLQSLETKLAENKELNENGGIIGFPAASINNMRIPGNLKSTYIFEEICSTLNQPPAICSEVIEMGTGIPTPREIEHPNYGWTISLIILITTIFFAIAFCLAKRCLRRRMSA